MITASIESKSEPTDFSDDDAEPQQEPRVLTEEFGDRAEPNASELAVLEVETAKIEETVPENNQEFESGAFYSKAVDEHKVLKHEEVLELYEQMKGKNAEEARGKMILHNLRLVWFVARKYQGHGVSRDDLIQEGTIGLMKAVEKFDPARGFRFGTYAIWWVRQHIGRFIQDQGAQVRLPVHIHDLRRRIKKVAAELQHKLGHRPSIVEIAEGAECTKEKVIEAFEGLGNASFSFDAAVSIGNGETGATHGELFTDDQQIDPLESLIIKEGSSEVADELKLLLQALETIPEKKSMIFRDCYGLTEGSMRLYNNLTLTATKFNMTRERMRQVRNHVWKTFKIRYPNLKLDHESLSHLRSNTSLFEQVWNQARIEEPNDGLPRKGPKNESKVKRLLVSGRQKLQIAHIRASPAYVRWRAAKKSKSSPGSLVIEFVSFAYEVSEHNLRGHGKQGPESAWARQVAGYIMQNADMNPKEIMAYFINPYGQQLVENQLLVPETMRKDPLISKDVGGMRDHFAKFVPPSRFKN